MAREARRVLADSRAFEEQNVRQSLQGGSRFIGAGATPSMGLSQFVGGGGGNCGCDCCRGSSSDEDMHGGAARPGAVRPGTTHRLSRSGPRAYAGPTSTAIVPYNPNQPVRGPLVPYVAPRRARPPPTTLTTRQPGTIKKYSPAEAKFRLDQMKNLQQTPAAATKKGPSSKAKLLKKAALLIAAGVPLALLATYLAGGLGPDGQPDGSGDGGGEIISDELCQMRPDLCQPPPPPGPDDVGDDDDGDDDDGDDDGGDDGGLTPQEVQFYLQSGNLPDRYYAGPRSRKGGFKMGVEHFGFTQDMLNRMLRPVEIPTPSRTYFGEQANPLMTTEQLEFVASHPNDKFTATGQYIRKPNEFGVMFPISGPNAFKNPSYKWGIKTSYFDPPPLPSDPVQLRPEQQIPNRKPVTDDEILAEADKITQLNKGIRTAVYRPYEVDILKKAAAIRNKRKPIRKPYMPTRSPPNMSNMKGILGSMFKGSGRSSGRAAIVKNVMSEMGMGLIDASRYVKANNLY